MVKINLKILIVIVFALIEIGLAKRANLKCSKRFQNKMLKLHNLERPKHNAATLKLNKNLSKSAKAWASELAKRNKGLVHSGYENMGENLAAIFGGTDMNRCASKTIQQNL